VTGALLNVAQDSGISSAEYILNEAIKAGVSPEFSVMDR
jgi:hypothetical protein